MDCSFTLLDLNHDCLSEVIKKLNNCHLLFLKLTAKSVAFNPLIFKCVIDWTLIPLESVEDGEIVVMNYLFKRFNLKYSASYLSRVNPNKIGSFRWLVSLVRSSGYVSQVDYLDAYTHLACTSSVLEAVKDAYDAIEIFLTKEKFLPNYSSKKEYKILLRGFTPEQIMRIYNKWQEASESLIPPQCFQHIKQIILKGHKQIGKWNLRNLLPMIEYKETPPYIWTNITEEAVHSRHFVLVDYAVTKQYISKYQVITMCNFWLDLCKRYPDPVKAAEYTQYMESLEANDE